MLAIRANRLRSNVDMKTSRTIVRLCNLITVRDQESRNVYLEMGIDPSHAATTADPAFLFNAKETPRNSDLKERLRARGKVFGINVVHKAQAHLDIYKMSIARTCQYLHSRYGYLPVFFCNKIRPGNFFDFDANSQTVALLKCEYELLDPICYRPVEMIDILSAFEFVIGMLMHVLIFDAIASIPFVAVSRLDKVDNFMRLFGLRSSGTVVRCDSKELIADMERLLDGRYAFQNPTSEQVSMLRQKCWMNVDLVRDLLDQRKASWHKVTITSHSFSLAESNIVRKMSH